MIELSVIVPCYNSQSYLSRCLDSLIKIKNQNVEFLLINDGSTDSTAAIIDRYKSKDTRFKSFSKDNGGYSTAINLGIDKSTGLYLMFLGSDDEVYANELDLLLKKALSNLPDICFFGTRIEYDDGTSKLDQYTTYKNVDKLFSTDVYSLCELVGSDHEIVFARDTSRLFKRDIIGNTRYYGKRGVSADGCFSSLVATDSNSFLFSDLICYKWNCRKNSVSNRKKSVDLLLDEFIVWESFFNTIREKYQNRFIPRMIISYLWAYLEVCESLKKEKKSEYKIGYKHFRSYKKWLLHKKGVSFKDKFRLRFAKLFSFYRKKKNKKRYPRIYE